VTGQVADRRTCDLLARRRAPRHTSPHEHTGESRFGREWAEAEVAAISEALARLEAWAEGRDPVEVKAAFVRQLRSLGGPFVPSSEIKIMARGVAEPGRPHRDPDGWEALLADAEAEARVDAQLVRQADQSSARLRGRVDRCRGSAASRWGARRTMDGFEFEVYIEPWSPKLTRRVERRARPTQVVVKPLTGSE
jgi:hypothetical protein